MALPSTKLVDEMVSAHDPYLRSRGLHRNPEQARFSRGYMVPRDPMMPPSQSSGESPPHRKPDGQWRSGVHPWGSPHYKMSPSPSCEGAASVMRASPELSALDFEARIKKAFDLFDNNGSGEIDLLELENAIEVLVGSKPHPRILKRLFEVADINGDGVMDRDEWYELAKLGETLMNESTKAAPELEKDLSQNVQNLFRGHRRRGVKEVQNSREFSANTGMSIASEKGMVMGLSEAIRGLDPNSTFVPTTSSQMENMNSSAHPENCTCPRCVKARMHKNNYIPDSVSNKIQREAEEAASSASSQVKVTMEAQLEAEKQWRFQQQCLGRVQADLSKCREEERKLQKDKLAYRGGPDIQKSLAAAVQAREAADVRVTETLAAYEQAETVVKLAALKLREARAAEQEGQKAVYELKSLKQNPLSIRFAETVASPQRR